MSLKDIRDEHKDSEGDPMLRARVRKLQSEMSQRRMLDDVPRANVVVTNPTHFAVAIEYDRKTMSAPKVHCERGRPSRTSNHRDWRETRNSDRGTQAGCTVSVFSCRCWQHGSLRTVPGDGGNSQLHRQAQRWALNE